MAGNFSNRIFLLRLISLLTLVAVMLGLDHLAGLDPLPAALGGLVAALAVRLVLMKAWR